MVPESLRSTCHGVCVGEEWWVLNSSLHGWRGAGGGTGGRMEGREKGGTSRGMGGGGGERGGEGGKRRDDSDDMHVHVCMCRLIARHSDTIPR